MNNEIADDPPFFRLISEADLATRYNRSIRTLQRWRRDGTAPAWIRIGGRIFYRIDDVSAFEARARRDQAG